MHSRAFSKFVCHDGSNRQEMGAYISHPTVFEEPLRIRYRANSLGAWICEIIGLLTVLIVPFVICLAMSNFWTQYNVMTLQPKVVFTERCMLKYRLASGLDQLWGCSDELYDALSGDERQATPWFSYYSDDHNGDNVSDSFVFTFRLPLPSLTDGVASFEFLPEFEVSFSNYVKKLRMLTAPFVTVREGGMDAFRAVVVHGELRYRETELLRAVQNVRYDRVYTSSLFPTVTTVNAAANIGALAAQYALQNQSLSFETRTTAVGDLSLLQFDEPAGVVVDADAARSVSVVLHMRVVESSVAYRPGYGEIIKWAWVQYFTVAYIIYWIVGWGRWLFVKQALINTMAVWEGRQVQS